MSARTKRVCDLLGRLAGAREAAYKELLGPDSLQLEPGRARALKLVLGLHCRHHHTAVQRDWITRDFYCADCQAGVREGGGHELA